VCCAERPDWLEAVLKESGLRVTTVEDAIAEYARVA